MDNELKDKLEWTVIFVYEFGRRHGLTTKQAFDYLHRHGGIDFVDECYGIAHTLSFDDMVDSATEFCQRRGGELGVTDERGNPGTLRRVRTEDEMKHYTVAHMATFLMEDDLGLTMAQALALVFNSETYAKLLDERTWLYSMGPVYVYSFLRHELKTGRMG